MPARGSIVDGHTVRFERELLCPIETAWDYLTQSGRLATWLAEGSVEPRVGGRVVLNFDVEEVPERERGGAAITGVVSLCVPRRVLAYTWTPPEEIDSAAESDAPSSTVTFELEPREHNTKLTLTHRHLRSEALARCGAGWHTHLDVLMARIQNRQPESFREVWQRLLPAYEQQAVALR